MSNWNGSSPRRSLFQSNEDARTRAASEKERKGKMPMMIEDLLGSTSKQTASKRKTAKHRASKQKTAKRTASKRKTAKHTASKQKTAKRTASKRTTASINDLSTPATKVAASQANVVEMHLGLSWEIKNSVIPP